MPTDELSPEIQDPPTPWKCMGTWAVGGLLQIGYAEDSDLLLVLSSQGRGIFDCKTGEKLARDYDEDNDCFDPVRLLAQGFGPLEGKTIRMAGLFGGGLTRTTADWWSLDDIAPAWPTHSIRLTALSSVREDGSFSREEPVVVGDSGACELRAYGFSETGQSFIIAISCDLVIFAR